MPWLVLGQRRGLRTDRPQRGGGLRRAMVGRGRALLVQLGHRVACDTLVREDGITFAVLASHAGEPLTVTPALAGGGGLTAVDGTQVGGSITTAPFGISVLRVTE